MAKNESHPERRLYSLAEQQAGYFTSQQALAAGYSRRQLTYYVKAGRFLHVKPGIYRLALFPTSAYEDLFVAWLEVGPKAVISHDTALALYDLSDVLPSEIHLTVPRTSSRRHRNLRLHTGQLTPEETVRLHGLPITAVPRTLADVAAAGLADELVIQAARQAADKGLVTIERLENTATQRGGRLKRLIERALEKKL